MDTRCGGPGERIVFEPYSREMFERSFDWVTKHAIFEPTTKSGHLACFAIAAVRRKRRLSANASISKAR